jgi:hypothetical protein
MQKFSKSSILSSSQGMKSRRLACRSIPGGFHLEQDSGLIRLGALVHHLDVGGIPIAEASGFATIMADARSLQPDDDALLKP